MSPREVDESTLWEFACTVEGYRKANSTEEEAPPTMGDDDLAKLGIEGFS
ncbi:hypothetical protein IG197_27675 [Aminobacter sp. SR38]|jgi:hypothetical protein|nr:hypothetical protein [Aminobacter sp. SR38]QOF74429.1 hypothetical protein IG197_27675 [Aminobacter sp. SR38]